MTHPLVAGLPRPQSGAITLYLLGPRPGEAIVIALPDGRWIAIDSCLEAGENVACQLLLDLGVERLALAILTHPDADHYRGFADLVACFKPERLWTFPIYSLRRELVATLARRDTGDGRWQELSAALETIDAAMRTNRAEPVAALRRLELSDVDLLCVAPCSADQSEVGRQLRNLLLGIVDGAPITDEDGHLVRGRKLDGSAPACGCAMSHQSRPWPRA